MGTGYLKRPDVVYIDPELKIILLWNSFFGDPSYEFRNL